MQVDLAYGRSNLTVELPNDVVVLQPKLVAGLADEQEALRKALRNPIGCAALRDQVGPQDDVVIVFSDITRPMPNDRVLPVLLKELDHLPRERITLINALGTHRENTREELVEMLGEEIFVNYRIIQHDGWDESALVNLGTTRAGNQVRVNSTFARASFKILTGFIEPHIFAGFSGGPKAVLPGVAAFDTILYNHGFEMLNNATATWGHIEDNPVWLEMMQAAQMAEPDFLLNVTLNRKKELTGVFAGELEAAHAKGVEMARNTAMVAVDRPFDVVITTNSGYPLDLNLYQSIKGMSSAAQIVAEGGDIIMASECSKGIPEHGAYRDLVHRAGSVEGIIQMLSDPEFRSHDQWQLQLQARLLAKVRVHLYADGLTDEQIEGMLFTPCHNIEDTVAQCVERHGPAARICVLPEGPQTIPYLSGN